MIREEETGKRGVGEGIRVPKMDRQYCCRGRFHICP